MSRNLFRSLKPFVLISVVFGLTGCKMTSGRHREASGTNYFHRVRVVVTAIVGGAITYKFTDNSTDDLSSESLFRNFMSEKQLVFFKAYLSYLSVLAALLIGTFRQRSIILVSIYIYIINHFSRTNTFVICFSFSFFRKPRNTTKKLDSSGTERKANF